MPQKRFRPAFGGFHTALLGIGIYLAAFFISIFICISIFNKLTNSQIRGKRTDSAKVERLSVQPG
jgi:hypothetical protein